MEQAQCRFEVVDGRIAGNDDREPALRPLMKRGEDQRPRFERSSGDVDAVIALDRALQELAASNLGAELGSDRAQVSASLCGAYYGAKYPPIVLAVSFGEFSSTRTVLHSLCFANDVT